MKVEDTEHPAASLSRFPATVKLMIGFAAGCTLRDVWGTISKARFLPSSDFEMLVLRRVHSDLLSFDLSAEMRKRNWVANVFPSGNCRHVPPLMARDRIEMVASWLLDDARSGRALLLERESWPLAPIGGPSYRDRSPPLGAVA